MLKGTALYELISVMGYWYKTLSKNANEQVATKYSFGNHSKQYLVHFYSPEKINPNKPLILYYHGGGWVFGKPELFAEKASIFTQQGYQVIIPSYRKVPFFDFNDMREDLSLTLKKIQDLREKGKVENRKIILGGTSAGGNLVSLLYLQKEELRKIGLDAGEFPGMFLTAPPLDLREMKRSPVLRMFAGKKDSALFRKASPLNYLDQAEAIKILNFHGTKDGLVNFEASQSFLKQYEEKFPGHVKHITLQNYGHVEAASWAHSNNFIRQELLSWLDQF